MPKYHPDAETTITYRHGEGKVYITTTQRRIAHEIAARQKLPTPKEDNGIYSIELRDTMCMDPVRLVRIWQPRTRQGEDDDT